MLQKRGNFQNLAQRTTWLQKWPQSLERAAQAPPSRVPPSQAMTKQCWLMPIDGISHTIQHSCAICVRNAANLSILRCSLTHTLKGIALAEPAATSHHFPAPQSGAYLHTHHYHFVANEPPLATAAAQGLISPAVYGPLPWVCADGFSPSSEDPVSIHTVWHTIL